MVVRRRLGRVSGLALLVLLFSAPVSLVQAALVWQTETAEADGNVGQYTSLALDASGLPHISHLDSDDFNLMYTHYTGTAWETETVVFAGGAAVAGATSLALDGGGLPHISYGNANFISYALYTGTAWDIETLEPGGFPSLALDSSGLPHISYSSGDLKYAHHTGTAWDIVTVDSANSASTSLALDASGLPHISYVELIDGFTANLKYAHYDGSGWQTETIDSTGDVGGNTSLALDGDGLPHISYHDFTNGDLKYARYTGTAWDIETVDSEGNVGVISSLALDSSDLPHISYYDVVAFVAGDLKYAHLTGTGWDIATVDSAGDVGWDNSLALDSSDLPHISYRDLTNRTLKFASGQPGNGPPTVEAVGPYTGDEGNPISLDGAVSDPESDALTTAWSYTIDSADPGTSCSFGDASMVDTTFTCDDDGSFTLTLSADDGTNPPVSDSASVTISNLAPTITETRGEVAGSQATITVDAVDPGANDTLSYAFDCDNDDTYELGPQAGNTATCALDAQQEGSFQINVQVSDDDGGIATDSVTVTVIIPTNLCANDYTGVLRYAESCRDYETAITIPDDDGPVTVCANTHNGLLRSPSNGVCAGHEVTYVLPEDGPLNVCVNTYTQVMRVVDEMIQCQPHELRRVLAATEVGETPSPRPS